MVHVRKKRTWFTCKSLIDNDACSGVCVILLMRKYLHCRLETPKHMRSDVLIGLVQDVWKDVKNRPPISLIAQKIEILCEKDFSYIDMNLMRSYMDI